MGHNFLQMPCDGNHETPRQPRMELSVLMPIINPKIQTESRIQNVHQPLESIEQQAKWPL